MTFQICILLQVPPVHSCLSDLFRGQISSGHDHLPAEPPRAPVRVPQYPLLHPHHHPYSVRWSYLQHFSFYFITQCYILKFSLCPKSSSTLMVRLELRGLFPTNLAGFVVIIHDNVLKEIFQKSHVLLSIQFEPLWHFLKYFLCLTALLWMAHNITSLTDEMKCLFLNDDRDLIIEAHYTSILRATRHD